MRICLSALRSLLRQQRPKETDEYFLLAQVTSEHQNQKPPGLAQELQWEAVQLNSGEKLDNVSHWYDVWLWVDYPTSLNLNFIIYKTWLNDTLLSKHFCRAYFKHLVALGVWFCSYNCSPLQLKFVCSQTHTNGKMYHCQRASGSFSQEQRVNQALYWFWLTKFWDFRNRIIS